MRYLARRALREVQVQCTGSNVAPARVYAGAPLREAQNLNKWGPMLRSRRRCFFIWCFDARDRDVMRNLTFIHIPSRIFFVNAFGGKLCVRNKRISFSRIYSPRTAMPESRMARRHGDFNECF